MSCVNIKSKEFKDTSTRLGVSAASLELIVHEYQNSMEGEFPSDMYILSRIGIGRSYVEKSSSVRNVWSKLYQESQEFSSTEELAKAVEEASKYFPSEQIFSYTTSDGKFVMRVAQPVSKAQESSPKKSLKRKNTWRERRYKKEQRLLPKEIRDKVDNLISQYMDKSGKGEPHPDVASEYFDKGDKTSVELVDNIIEKSADSEVVELAKAIRKAMGDSGIPVKFKKESDGTLRGQYNSDGTISIYNAATKGATVDEAKASMERTILHEIVHSMTISALESNQTLKDEIADVMTEYANYTESNGLHQSYSLKNEKEFVAEFLSQPRFREALMNLKSKQKLSFGQRIINVIKKALGMKTSDTLFARADKAIRKLLDTQAESIYDNVSEENEIYTAASSKSDRQKFLQQIAKEHPESKNRPYITKDVFASFGETKPGDHYAIVVPQGMGRAEVRDWFKGIIGGRAQATAFRLGKEIKYTDREGNPITKIYISFPNKAADSSKYSAKSTTNFSEAEAEYYRNLSEDEKASQWALEQQELAEDRAWDIDEGNFEETLSTFEDVQRSLQESGKLLYMSKNDPRLGGRLAAVQLDGTVKIANDFTLKEFWDYIGASNSATSKQKGEVFANVRKVFNNLEFIIDSVDKAKTMLLYREMSHIMNNDLAQYPLTEEGKFDVMHPKAISIETRATIDAVNRMLVEGLDDMVVKTIWERRYSRPRKFAGKEFLDKAVEEAKKYFNPESISTYKDNSGSYVMTVVKPSAKPVKAAQTTAETTDKTLVVTGSSSNTAQKAREIGGIDTLRHPDANGMHFGNPFSHQDYAGVQKKVGSVSEAVTAFEQWLRGEAYQDIEPERRKWIWEQITNGSLVGKPLVYYTDSIKDTDGQTKQYDAEKFPNHAHILAKLINEFNPSKNFTSNNEAKASNQETEETKKEAEAPSPVELPTEPPVSKELYEKVEKLSPYFEGGSLTIFDVFPNISGDLAAKLDNHFFMGEEITIQEYEELEQLFNNQNPTTMREQELTPEMKSIRQNAVHAGTFMKAPNGNPSKLSMKQWLLARTEAFKRKFGNWEKAAKTRTPIKEEYKGKLIFAQSGTGKSTVADNINVIDSDYLLGKLLGVPTSLVTDAFRLLSPKEKTEASAKYGQLILDTVRSGKTVVTANLNMIKDADYVFYNETAELADSRTTNSERGNNFKDTAYQEDTIRRIKESRPDAVALHSDEFLGTKILTNPSFKVDEARIRETNSIREALQTFFDNFGVSLEEAASKGYTVDKLNRLIKGNSTEDFIKGSGELIAYMMQYNPDVKNIIIDLAREEGELSEEDLVPGRRDKTYKKLNKDKYFKVVGEAISKELEYQYNRVKAGKTFDSEKAKPKGSLFEKVRNIIVDFFKKLVSMESTIDTLANYSRYTAINVLKNNDSIVRKSLRKPGDEGAGPVSQVDAIKALRDNPYEFGIIKALSDNGIVLAGSTAISMGGTVYRPSENPLHDLDFETDNNMKKDELESILHRLFPNFEYVRSIANDTYTTQTYLVLDRPFFIKRQAEGVAVEGIYDKETGKYLGCFVGNNLTLEEGVKGKLLDFFTEETIKYKPIEYDVDGEKVKFSDPRNAVGAKIEYGRLKDIFDYNRYVPFNFQSSTQNEEVSIEVDENGEPLFVDDGTGTANTVNEFDNGIELKPETKQYLQEQVAFTKSVDNLIGGSTIKASEARHIAEQMVYWISDHITELQEHPEKIAEYYGKEIDVTGKTRAEIINAIGVDNVINKAKDKFQSTKFAKRSTSKKARLIVENWSTLMKLAYDVFGKIEDFSIVQQANGESVVITEINADADNFNTPNDEDTTRETEGDSQEHWQIESRTIDVLSSMSQLIRQRLMKCFLLEKTGTDMNGEPIYDNKRSEFGINERIPVRDATSSILRWTQGALTLDDMIAKMQEKEADNTWVKPIIQMLLDKSGKETDFQSQFFGVFCKHFQAYSIVIKEDGSYKSIQVNELPALKEAVASVTTQFKIGEHPMFGINGVNTSAYENFHKTATELRDMRKKKFEELDREQIVENLTYMSGLLGYYAAREMIDEALNAKTFREMVDAVLYMDKSIGENVNNKTYDPFAFKSNGSINGNLRAFLKPLTDKLEDVAVSSFYDSGKMYQSYVTPSYMTKLMQKFKLNGNDFDRFVMEQYGNFAWFKQNTGDIETGWRNEWLRRLATDDAAKRIFAHKVQLNFNKHNYMRNMSDTEYTLSLFAEYFADAVNEKDPDRTAAWFRVPMLSNKPSSEFIRFYSYRGTNYKRSITEGLKKIFDQELSRIQTVEMRDYDKSDPRFIKNFDSNGKKFCFLDFMNDYLSGKKTDSIVNNGDGTTRKVNVHELLRKKLDGKELTTEQETDLNNAVKNIIYNTMNERAAKILTDWKAKGLVEGAKQISNVGTTEAEIMANLENFIWNDTFAAMNIMEMTITDIAYYKDAEDLQKRLAQIHAPGIRANAAATDYEGRRVTDGKMRTFYLKDFDGFKSNIKENVSIVFDRKISAAKTVEEEAALRALKESILKQFDEINVADAQGYSSPTSYRKKALMFGKWSKEAEEIYQKLKRGDYNYSDLAVAFQPLKPFVYSQISKDMGVPNAPLATNPVPVQNKNSEYLLIMTDAILQGEETGRPNLLRAIFEVMEESAERDNTRGIDTVQFESTVKSGLMGRIDINSYQYAKNGEAKAKKLMSMLIYGKDGAYNSTFVHEIPVEDYCEQQQVPEHFKGHEQAHGSQIRYIIQSDLEDIDYNGEPVTYEVEGRKLTANEFKAEYEKTIAENINESIANLQTELGLDNLTNPIERNVALSKILQREILSSPRYGIDLLQACSLDEKGQFRIPLGDPIQSKRVEQLLNSIIKNRVNKQKIAGGPVVQVTNFGTSRELNIRFKDKKGELLQTRKEFKGTDEEYKAYINENQGGIAYFEVFAPIYSNELFKQFADERGNIDIKTIEAINPDLLKMIGYRIPTEDKYSMAPLKIVGFLPREAGDGIMMPNDITLLTGSDFDVDKMYLMRKEIDIAKRFIQKEGETMSEAEEDYLKHNKASVRDAIKSALTTDQVDVYTTEAERAAISKTAKGIFDVDRRTAERKYQSELEEIERRNEIAEEAIDKKTYSSNEEKNEERYNARADRQETYYEKQKSKAKERYEAELGKIDAREDEYVSKEISRLYKDSLNKLINNFLDIDRFQSSEMDDATTAAIRKAYLQYMYHSVEPASGRVYRNNKIVDMTYTVLTHETTADKMLNPGGFDPQRRQGYMTEAYRNPNNNYTWEELQAKSVDKLKDICYTSKNLSFVDTHVQFYKQNAAAGSLIGMFAVHKVAHAVLESNGYQIDVESICNPFTVAGITFDGRMEIDAKYDKKGQLIGKTLGNLVASAADAVKDPILNLMNINGHTANLLNTLLRLGMPFETAALLLSQKIVTDVLTTFNKENISNYKKLSDVISDAISNIEKETGLSEGNKINKEELTEEEMVKGLKENKAESDYKTLKVLQNIQLISTAMKGLTFATRFNSISSAVGPLIIDNLIIEYKMKQFSDCIYDSQGNNIGMRDILISHPILRSFSQTVGIARELFGNMPANSEGFRRVLDSTAESPLSDLLYSDRKLLGQLSDFYQSYLVMASGVVDSKNMKKYIGEFPTWFFKQKFKEKYPDNLLIQSIKLETNKDNGRAALKIDTTGLDTQQKEALSSAWIDLHKENPELSTKLFMYNFFRSGIGFSPKTFMALVPTYVKERIPGYVDTFRRLPLVSPELVINQFVRNNWDNNKLVPKKSDLKVVQKKDGYVSIYGDKAVKEMSKVPFFKRKVGGRDVLYQLVGALKSEVIFKEITPLGNNKEYLEISTSDITEPANIPAVAKEAETIDSELNDIYSDAYDVSATPDRSNQELTDLVYQIFNGWYGNQAEAKLFEWKTKTEEEKAELESKVKSYMEAQFEKLGITYDKSLVDEAYEEMCS